MTYIQKCTLVPARYFDEKVSRCFLSSLFELEETDDVKWVEVPRYDAVLVYVPVNGGTPVLLELIDSIGRCNEYNRILMSVDSGCLSLVIAGGGNLLFANTFPAPDFTTAEYYVFLAMKSLQMNPELSTISVKSELSEDEEMSLYRYFKNVERI